MTNLAQIPCNRLRFAAALLTAGLVGGCGGGGSGGAGATLSLSLTDAPVDSAEAVVIEFTEVQVHSAGGSTYTFNLATPMQIDLVQLSGGASTLLLTESLPAGDYEWIRLFVNEDNSYIMIGGNQEALHIPSNAQTGLKLNHPFTLDTDGVASFVIDFDLRKSVHDPSSSNQPYLLRPTLRIVDATVTGSISGNVDATLLADAGCTGGDVVYVYEGAGVTPDDVGSATEPVTTAPVTFNVDHYEYTAAFLEPGDYTVAFTCQAADDDPAADDAIVFVGAADVTVTSGMTTTYDFPAL